MALSANSAHYSASMKHSVSIGKVSSDKGPSVQVFSKETQWLVFRKIESQEWKICKTGTCVGFRVSKFLFKEQNWKTLVIYFLRFWNCQSGIWWTEAGKWNCGNPSVKMERNHYTSILWGHFVYLGIPMQWRKSKKILLKALNCPQDTEKNCPVNSGEQ